MGKNERIFAVILLCTIIGIVFAIVLQVLYDQSIFVDEIVSSTLTLREIQLVVILTWEILGIGIAALESGGA